MEPSLAPSPKRLRNYKSEWPASSHDRFNFHRESQLRELLDMALSDTGPAVVVLAGEPGIGRGYFCQAVRHLADKEGHSLGLWDFDLGGFEPDNRSPLGQFLNQLFEEQASGDSAALEREAGVDESVATLKDADVGGEAGDWAASLLSLAWQFEDVAERVVEVLKRSGSGGQPAPREDPATLKAFLEELSSQRKLLIHVRDSSRWTNAQRRWFIREAEHAPERLLLVISCRVETETRWVVPTCQHQPARIELRPLTARDLRQALDRRFTPNALPEDLVDRFVARLVEVSNGRPGAIANQMADWVESGALDVDSDGSWRWSADGLEDPRVVQALSTGLYECIDRRLAEEEPQKQRVLRDVLILAALGGTFVPIPLIFEYLGLAPEAREEVTDFVDDVLEEELEWLVDAGFQHPSFAGLNVYAFTHPLLPGVILDQITELDREVAAIKFLRFLESALQSRHRGMTRWFLAIAEHLGPKEQLLYELQLAWWCGQDDAEALHQEVRAKLEARELGLETVWRIVRESIGWPAFRRLAVLNAYAEAEVGEGDATLELLSFEELARFHALRADLLLQQGRYVDALEDAQLVIPLVEEHSAGHARALNLSGVARLHLGQLQAAGHDFEQTVDIYRPMLGPDHPVTLSAQANLAVAVEKQGKSEQSEQLMDDVLEASRRVLGPEHPDTLRIEAYRRGLSGE